MKALFIPLITKYFEQFESGDKLTEYRLYGKRWNENTVFPGRPVTLSKGYGRYKRLKTKVVRLRKVKNTFTDIYPRGVILAAIDVCPHIQKMRLVVY